MIEEGASSSRSDRSPALLNCTSVTNIATRRRGEDVLETVTLVFGGVHYGTFPVSARYTAGKPLMLFIVPSRSAPIPGDDLLSGPLDCLITDDPALALESAVG